MLKGRPTGGSTGAKQVSKRRGLNGTEKWALSVLLNKVQDMPVRFVLWSGDEFCVSKAAPATTLHIGDPKALFGLLFNPSICFGDGYSSGRLRVEGDLVTFVEDLFRLIDKRQTGRSNIENSSLIDRLPLEWVEGLRSRWLRARQKNTLRGSQKNIHYQYDIGNDFYKLWLDSQLVYTSAYFQSPDSSLEEAQVAKLDYVCRKVQLQPGDVVAEAGCGWGALALHMARNYGALVKAFNISREQLSYARQRAREEGLSGRVEFIEDDYRNISGRFDVFMSVGMLEHVGLEHYSELGGVMDRSLHASGRGLLHFIGRNSEYPLNIWIRKRTFPGAHPPTLRKAVEMFEPRSFSVLDVENLRLHYAKTLEHWLERFERSVDLVSAMFDQEFVRAWRFYLAGSLASFRAGWLQLFQVTFARASSNRIPWSRSYLYRDLETRPRREVSVLSRK